MPSSSALSSAHHRAEISNLTSIFSDSAGPAIWACVATALASIFIVLTQRWHGRFSLDSHAGLQKFHVNPTPRIGGAAVIFGVFVGWWAMDRTFHELTWPIIVAGFPAFLCGLLEDVTKKVGVRTRLLITMLCGVLGWLITGNSITTISFPGVDWILQFTVFSVLFTAFAVGGVANAINIIDGFNGLASGVVVIILCGLTAIAVMTGDFQLAGVCIVFAGAILGFLSINWPSGKIFLGDGGAYFIGFVVAWIAVTLLSRNHDISPWAPLLVCGYPVLEVGFSIIRKSLRTGHHPGAPDRVHLHMLIYRRVARVLFRQLKPSSKNGATSLFAWCYALFPCLWAVFFFRNTMMLVLGFFTSALIYYTIYHRLTQFNWRFWSKRQRAALNEEDSILNVLLVCSTSDLSGAPLHLKVLAEELVLRGHKVAVAAGGSGKAFVSSSSKSLLTRIDGLENSAGVASSLRAMLQLRGLIQHLHIDVVHCHSTKAGLIGRIAALGLGRRLVFTVHGWGFGPGRRKTNAIISYLIEVLVGWISTDIYLCVSQADTDMGTRFLPFLRKKIRTARNGIADISHALVSNRLRPTLEKLDNRPTAIMVARTGYQKNHRLLAEAIALVGDSWKFILVGSGTNDTNFRAEFLSIAGEENSPTIEFVGESDDVEGYLARSDVFVLTSRYEGLPISIIEAMRAGLPIVASDVGGVRELPAVVDFLLAADAPALILARHLRALLDAKLRAEISAKERSRYLEAFDSKKMVNIVLAAYAGT